MQKKIINTIVLEYSFGELPEEHKLLIEEAKKQVFKAYAPYSEFHVGAAVRLVNDEIFAASNQENSAYPSGLCAERNAVFYANAQRPDIAVKSIAIAAYTKGNFLKTPITPCGSCRQVLLETEQRYNNDILIILYGLEKTYIVGNVKQLLPLCFEKNSLINKTD